MNIPNDTHTTPAPHTGALAHYTQMLEEAKAANDARRRPSDECRLELLRDLEADIAAEQAFDATCRGGS